MSKDSLSSALKQPNTIQIRLKIPGNGRDAQTKERCDDVIPDKVILGAEYALVHVLPDFEKNLQPFCELKQQRIRNHQVSAMGALLARESPHQMGNRQGQLSNRC